MAKIQGTLLLLAAAGLAALHPAAAGAQDTKAALQHHRLTFVLTYPHNEQPEQRFALDVPVAKDKPGISGMNLVSGLAGQSTGSVEESLQCTEVRESATGLAAKVVFAIHTQVDENLSEPIHHQLNFNREIDVALGSPTRITEEMHRIPLGRNGEANANALPAPVIKVTAEKL